MDAKLGMPTSGRNLTSHIRAEKVENRASGPELCEFYLKQTTLLDKFRAMISPREVFCLLGFALAASAIAQSPDAARNLVRNPGFESGSDSDELSGGVTKDGYLAGYRFSASVLTAGGNIGRTPMPISVAVADMNGDGLNDIVAADPLGFIRIYFNKGTREEPKFTHGEMVGVFLSWTPETAAAYSGPRTQMLRVPRISLSEVNSRQAIYLGNYRGDLMRLPNDGSASTPEFRQPASLDRVTIPTMKDPTRRWGNVFAPAAYDWNRDGKTDILMGEGSYSANSVHLLINQGSTLAPRFDEENRYFLAFGDGREQLSPTVVDYNGDGRPDLLVGDRSGQIGLYLNADPNWKPGDETPFVGYLKSGAGSVEEVRKGTGSTMNFVGVCTVATGDFTGDGLFDLVVGKTNGRIALVRNVGTPGSPKWQAPVEIKAESPGPNARRPASWTINDGASRGNFYGVIETVTEEQIPGLAPPEGKSSLRMGYAKPKNEIMKTPSIVFPGVEKFDPTKDNLRMGAYWNYPPSNVFMIRSNELRGLEAGKTYTLSFQVKGGDARGALAALLVEGRIDQTDVPLKTVSDRGAVDRRRGVHYFDEIRSFTVPFSVRSNWSEVKRDIKLEFRTRELNVPDTIRRAWVLLYVPLALGSGEVFIDDVKLIAK